MGGVKRVVAPLAVVAPVEVVEEPELELTVSEAVETGDERAVLVAMRRLIARTLDEKDVSARDLASNTRRVHELTKDIMAIDAKRRGLLPSPAGVEGAAGSDDELFDGTGI